jgi:GT2 family glycosyltransferase
MTPVATIAERPALESAPEAPVDLTVIVVTHNRTELALETLRAARAAAGGLAVEWIVIDSGSTDPTSDAIERTWDDVRVGRLGNVGFAAANNRGLEFARGRYVLLLNPDCVVADGTFETLVATLEESPRIGIASVVQLAPNGRVQYTIRRYPSARLAFGEALAASRYLPARALREEETRSRRYLTTQSADWLVGAFLIARAQALAEVGPLDERFFLYSEETDWCYRFRLAGWDVCHLPVMTVTHYTGTSYRPDLTAQLSYAKVLFALKHYSRRRSSTIRGALALRHLLRALAGRALGLVRPSWQARSLAEGHALAVVLGRADPPFGGSPTGG